MVLTLEPGSGGGIEGDGCGVNGGDGLDGGGGEGATMSTSASMATVGAASSVTAGPIHCICITANGVVVMS